MKTITPKSILSYVEKFCAEINGNKPFYVEVKPVCNAKNDDCFLNVNNKIAEEGGCIIYGWNIWLWPTIMLEAEFHANWKSNQGEVIDITPKINKETKVLFLPDDNITFSGKQINNIRKNLRTCKMVDKFIELHNEKFAILNTGDLAGQFGEVSVDSSLILPVVEKTQIIYGILKKKIRIANDLSCPCESGKQFSKCCNKYI